MVHEINEDSEGALQDIRLLYSQFMMSVTMAAPS